MILPLHDIGQKAPGCVGCPYSSIGNGFVPTWAPATARIAFLGEAPGQNEIIEREPFVGGTGRLLMKMLERQGLTRRDVLLANTLSCVGPGNKYPIGDMRKAAERHCRQYDDVAGLDLHHGGLLSFKPTHYMITLHPAVALRTWTLVRVIEADIAKAVRLSKKYRLLVLLGEKATELVLPELDIGIMKIRGHHNPLDWPAFIERTQGSRRIVL